MSKVSKRYAKALFSLASEEKKLDKVADDLLDIKNLIEKNDQFRAFLLNPLVSSSKQLEVVKSLFDGKINQLSLNFLFLLSEKKRLGLLAEILQKFDELLLLHRNQVMAEVVSASTLAENQLSAIKNNIEKMTSKKVLINSKKDKSLIGGFTVKIEDIIIDNSIRYQLEKLKEKLIS